MAKKGEKTASTLLFEMIKRSYLLEQPISHAQMERAKAIREQYDDRSLNLAPTKRKTPARRRQST